MDGAWGEFFTSSLPCASRTQDNGSSLPSTTTSEPIQRRSLLSNLKLIAEGTPKEIQFVLGWSMDTWRVFLSLPTDKFDAWMNDIQHISDKGKTTLGNLETTVGRLNHAAYVIPLARHFLNRLQSPLIYPKPKTQEITLSRHELKDLALWRRFVTMAHHDLSMNRLTIRQPTHLAFLDTCPFGFGGYNLQGRAWQIVSHTSAPYVATGASTTYLKLWVWPSASGSSVLFQLKTPNASCPLATTHPPLVGFSDPAT